MNQLTIDLYKVKRLKICGIYKITSPTGRVYIGQSIDIISRWKGYRNHLAKHQSGLNHSFLKHGIENHIFKIIMRCPKKTMDKYECAFIKTYKSCNDEYGMNIRAGGNTTPMTQKLKDKLSALHKQRFSENIELYNKTIEQLSKVKRKGRDNPMYGSGHILLSFDASLRLIKEYKSLFDVRLDGILNTNIYKCCNRQHKYKTINGCIWRFKDDCIVENGVLKEDILIKDFSKKSKYKGVKYNICERRWFANYWDRAFKKYIHIGCFKNEEDAHIGYVNFANKKNAA